MSPAMQDANRLQEIAAAFYGGRIDRDAARSRVADVVFDRLGCDRVSLWKFDRHDAGLRLLCFASKVRGGELDTREQHLEVGEYLPYLHALIEGGTLAADDAMHEPVLQPMREHYLVANHVVSMLDAAFLLNGRAYGMVCCEATQAPRQWKKVEAAALRSIVSRLAALMTSYDDEALWAAPSIPLNAIPVA